MEEELGAQRSRGIETEGGATGSRSADLSGYGPSPRAVIVGESFRAESFPDEHEFASTHQRAARTSAVHEHLRERHHTQIIGIAELVG